MDHPDLTPMLDRLRAGETLTAADLAELPADGFAGDTLGVTFDRVHLERLEAHLDCGPQHHQPYGIVHGGVWCGVIETLASVGAALRALEHGRLCVGVSNATDFLRSHRTGRVDAVATPVHVGRLQQLWQVELTRAADGKVVARGQVRLQNVDPAQIGG